MSRKVIISIVGKLYNLKKIKFKYKENEEECELLSIFLRKIFNKESYNVSNIYLIPHSIYHEEEEFLNLLKDEYGIVDGVFQKLLPSFGNVNKEGKTYKFINTYDFTRFYIFLNLLKFFLHHNDIDEIYVDINQGWNIYNDILKEAVRNFVTFYKLMFLNKGKYIKANLIFSEPIFASEGTTKEVFTVPIDTKVFFDSPIRREDTEQLKNLDFTIEEVKFLKSFYRVFSALKGNAPLVIFTFGYKSPETIMKFINSLVYKFLDYIDPQKADEDKFSMQISYKIPRNIPILINVFFSLALYYAISSELSSKGIKNNGQIWTNIEDLNKINSVYETFKLEVNKRLLDNDIRNIKNKAEKSLYDGEELRYCEIEEKPCIDLGNFVIDSKVKRNFWAHSGFERNILLVKKEKGEIFLSYHSKVREKLYLFLE